MKKVLLLVLMFMTIGLMVTVSVSAETATGVCGDNLTWTLSEDGTLTISGQGEMWDYGQVGMVLWSGYSSSIKAVVINSGVTSIGSRAFSGCEALTYVKIPSGVTNIGDEAFSYCRGLKTVEIGKDVTYIGPMVFYKCTALDNIVISEDNAAYSLQDGVIFNKEKTELVCCPNTVSGRYEIPDTVEKIQAYAFAGCSNITYIVFPKSLTYVDDGAFLDCEGLETVGFVAREFEVEDNLYIGFDNDYLEMANAEYNIYYNIKHTLSEDGTLTISGQGEMLDFNGDMAYPWEDYYNNATRIVVEEGVTTIGDYAFWYFRNVTDVELPDGLISIGEYSFARCIYLETINLPEGLKSIGRNAFSETNISAITLPESLEAIPNNAFADTPLKSVTIGKNIKGIDPNAFNNTQHLEEINVDSENTVYSSQDGVVFNKEKTKLMLCPNGKSGEYSVPESVTAIGDYAFRCCIRLTKINIPESVSKIGIGAFSSCHDLTEVSAAADSDYFCTEDSILFSKDKTSLVYYPYEKTGDSYIVPETVTKIENYAFEEAEFKQITLPKKLTYIGDNAFDYCSSLEEIIIPDSVTYIGGDAFSCCEGLKKAILPKGITEIKERTFSYCLALKSVIIPEGVTTIGYAAFCDCEALTRLYIPKSVVTIDRILYNCDALTEIHYGGSIADWSEVELSYYSRLEIRRKELIYDYVPIPESTYTTNADGTIALCVKIPLVQIPHTAELIVVGYNAESVPILQSKNIDGLNETESFTLAGDTTIVRVFLWDTITGLKPLSLSESLEI